MIRLLGAVWFLECPNYVTTLLYYSRQDSFYYNWHVEFSIYNLNGDVTKSDTWISGYKVQGDIVRHKRIACSCHSTYYSVRARIFLGGGQMGPLCRCARGSPLHSRGTIKNTVKNVHPGSATNAVKMIQELILDDTIKSCADLCFCNWAANTPIS